MAIRHMTYLALDASKRTEYATAYRAQIRQMLASPFMTPDQARVLMAQMDHIGKWENGILEVAAAPSADQLSPAAPEPISEPEADPMLAEESTPTPDPTPTPEPEPAPETQPEPAAEPAPETQPEPAAEPAPEATPEPAPADPQPEPEAATEPEPPSDGN